MSFSRVSLYEALSGRKKIEQKIEWDLVFVDKFVGSIHFKWDAYRPLKFTDHVIHLNIMQQQNKLWLNTLHVLGQLQSGSDFILIVKI